MTDQKDNWTKFYTANSTMAFPPEGLIRILKSSGYPGQKMPKPKPGQSLLDVGCGDGAAFALYDQIGLFAEGTEISDEIAVSTELRLTELGIKGMVHTGLCSSLPFKNDAFDYLVGWNSVYYMSIGSGHFPDHVAEMARVLKPDGWIIVSVPRPDCFIFDDVDTEGLADGYVRICSEHFGLRTGEIMRRFNKPSELEEAFSSHFTDFSHAQIDIRWFGLRYSWFVFTARKYNPEELSRKSLPESGTTAE